MKSKVYTSRDNNIFKMIHTDKTETIIKTETNCSGENNKDQYTVFLSSSYGCSEKCVFCMIHSKGLKFSNRSIISSFENAKKAISFYSKIKPLIKNKKVKISWMGMGEPLRNRSKVVCVSVLLQEWIMENGLASEIHGVDISTSLPNTTLPVDVITTINNLKDLSPHDIECRLFISLGSAIRETRDWMIGYHPKFISDVYDICYDMGSEDVIFHTFFLDGINDSEIEISTLIDFFKMTVLDKSQLRILRYNECDNSLFTESSKYEDIKERLINNIPNIKFQNSVGTELLGACGQFHEVD